jgi:predicted phage baseplate assembly protein
MRAGGGGAGNLPAGRLKDVTGATDAPVAGKITAVQALPATGGQDAETLAQAERRIPSFLAHRDRAVSAADFAALTYETPGVRVGRVEVLPGLRPATFDAQMPGVVSVLVLPAQDGLTGPAPRADRRLIEAVHGWLEPRRLIGTELYVVGPAYVPIGVSVAVEIRPGFDREATLMAVREAVRRYLWPLPPGGPFESTTGWPLGRPVRDRELEVAVARVPGVDEIHEVALFEVRGDSLRRVPARRGVATLPMRAWELPELVRVDAGDGATAPPLTPPTTDRVDEIAVPVVPEVC